MLSTPQGGATAQDEEVSLKLETETDLRQHMIAPSLVQDDATANTGKLMNIWSTCKKNVLLIDENCDLCYWDIYKNKIILSGINTNPFILI